MQLYFIRHGQSANNALWDATGSSRGRSEDPDLTALGHQQAQHVARFLQSKQTDVAVHSRDAQNVTGFPITHLYTSLMIRAVKTAEYVAEALGLPLVAWPEIYEEGGIYNDDAEGVAHGLPGKNRAYFETHHPTLQLPAWLDEAGWWNRPAETRDNYLPRAHNFLTDLLQRHANTQDRVAVVSHGAFFVNFLKVLLRLPESADAPRWFVMNNCAISRIDFEENFAAVVYLNRAQFLPAELVT
jgi:2,3-bisphosphoglycerate-dependent phosphoglycerate mutase